MTEYEAFLSEVMQTLRVMRMAAAFATVEKYAAQYQAFHGQRE